jgi:hypothetical protein
VHGWFGPFRSRFFPESGLRQVREPLFSKEVSATAC